MNYFLSELRLYLCNRWINKIPSHAIRQWYYKKIMKFRLGKNCAIMMDVRFDAANGLEMGQNSVINSNCRIDTRGGINIGENVAISQGVVVLTADHDLNSPSFLGRSKSVKIYDYVWIGTNAMVLPGVIIERGAAIAAGAIVTKNVTENAIVAGIPAKKIGIRSSEFKYNTIYKRLFQ